MKNKKVLFVNVVELLVTLALTFVCIKSVNLFSFFPTAGIVLGILALLVYLDLELFGPLKKGALIFYLFRSKRRKEQELRRCERAAVSEIFHENN